MSDLYNSIDELMLELEDENDDPVGRRTVAVVPGAFRPPHLGHVGLVEQYADKVDEVVVLVSSALKGNRGIGENSISAQQSKQVWQELLSDRGLSNVRVEVSPQPTRVSAILEYIGEGGPLEHGTEVILGIGNTGGSMERYESICKHAKRGVSIAPISETAMQPVTRPSGEPYRTADVRKILDEGGDADEFFGEGKTSSVRSILGMIEEMSSMAGGAVGGYGAPLGTRAKKKKKQSEYNELYLYKEVLRLLMKEGIIK